MVLVDKLDEIGKPAWIMLAVLGFIFWWPVGLAVLAFSIFSGRFGRHGMGCWQHQDGPWDRHMGRWQSKMERMQEKMDRLRGKMDQRAGNWWGTPPSSGNRAFDDYRSETLKRLEDEQREFKDFLARLRFAKDRAEFDQFMAERRQRPFGPDSQAETQPAEPRN